MLPSGHGQAGAHPQLPITLRSHGAKWDAQWALYSIARITPVNGWGELLLRQRIGGRWAPSGRGFWAMRTGERSAGQDAFLLGEFGLSCAEPINCACVFFPRFKDELPYLPIKGG